MSTAKNARHSVLLQPRSARHARKTHRQKNFRAQAQRSTGQHAKGMPMGRWHLGFSAGVLSGLFSATAAAQVTVAIGNVSRELPHGKLAVTQINYADCLANDTLHMTLNLGVGYASYGLEIWAGTDCDNSSNRQPATATCWLVHQGVPNSIVYQADISVRDLLRGRTGGGVADSGAPSIARPANPLR